MVEFMKLCFGSALVTGVGICICAGIAGYRAFNTTFTTPGLQNLASASGVFFMGFAIAVVSTAIWLVLDWHARRFPTTQALHSAKPAA